MFERVKPDSSIESKTNLDDQFTDAEKELIDKIIQELDTDDAREFELCKRKLVLAEQEILSLKAQLTKTLHQLQSEENASHNMLMHKQMIDLRNKLEASEAQFAKESKAKTLEVIVEEVPAEARRRPGQNSYAGSRSSWFSASSDSDSDDIDDDRAGCFKSDLCKIS